MFLTLMAPDRLRSAMELRFIEAAPFPDQIIPPKDVVEQNQIKHDRVVAGQMFRSKAKITTAGWAVKIEFSLICTPQPRWVVLLTHHYAGEKRSSDWRGSLLDGLVAGTLDAGQLLSGYCRLLYERYGTLEAVARRAHLDPRTVKKYLGPA